LENNAPQASYVPRAGKPDLLPRERLDIRRLFEKLLGVSN